jgi:septal ring factor EnvC (AmiA/AmiB activator)
MTGVHPVAAAGLAVAALTGITGSVALFMMWDGAASEAEALRVEREAMREEFAEMALRRIDEIAERADRVLDGPPEDSAEHRLEQAELEIEKLKMVVREYKEYNAELQEMLLKAKDMYRQASKERAVLSEKTEELGAECARLRRELDRLGGAAPAKE